MQNIVINMCEKFHDDRSRNDRALGDRKSDNNNKKNNVHSAWGPESLHTGVALRTAKCRLRFNLL